MLTLFNVREEPTASKVTDEPVEVRDCRKLKYQSRQIYGIYLKLIKKNQKFTTWNKLDFRTLTNYDQKSPQTLNLFYSTPAQSLQASQGV